MPEFWIVFPAVVARVEAFDVKVPPVVFITFPVIFAPFVKLPLFVKFPVTPTLFVITPVFVTFAVISAFDIKSPALVKVF